MATNFSTSSQFDPTRRGQLGEPANSSDLVLITDTSDTTGSASGREKFVTVGNLLAGASGVELDTSNLMQPGDLNPVYYASQSEFPAASTVHGAIAHSHADGAMYFAHGGTWNRIANASELSGFAASNHTHSEYADSDHNHDGDYASASHSHSEYATAQSVTDLTQLVDDNTMGIINHTHELNDISNVTTGTPSDGQVLAWNQANNQWEAVTVSASGSGLTNWAETNGHIIPDTNAAYDLGSAEKKVRHLYLSDNSIYMGTVDGNPESIRKIITLDESGGLVVSDVEQSLISEINTPGFDPTNLQVDPKQLIATNITDPNVEDVVKWNGSGWVNGQTSVDIDGPLTKALRGTGNPHIGANPNQSFKVIDNPSKSAMVVADADGNITYLLKGASAEVKVAKADGSAVRFALASDLPAFVLENDSGEPDIEVTDSATGEKISVISGDSDTKGANGLPVRQGYNLPDMGANPAPLLISGGSIA